MEEIGWYNDTLYNKTAEECRCWSRKMADFKKHNLDPLKDKFYLLAGKKYYQHLLAKGRLKYLFYLTFKWDWLYFELLKI